jgi:ribosomal protein S17
MIVRKVSCSVRVVGVVVSRIVSSKTYVIRRYTKHIISEYKHKNFYLTKYHITKEYFPFYSQDKRLSYRLIDNS